MDIGNAMTDNDVQPFEVMTRGPFAALLRVPEGGFSVQESLVALGSKAGEEGRGSPWLVKNPGAFVRQYAPLAVSNLLRRFTRLKPTPEAILAFANQYGFLGHSLWLRYSESGPVRTRVDEMPIGESLNFWRSEIEQIAQLMAVWELVRHERRQELSNFVQWSPPGHTQHVLLHLVSLGKELRPDLAQQARQRAPSLIEEVRQESNSVGYSIRWTSSVLAHEDISSGLELLGKWERGDPVEPARYYVHREVNKRLRGHVSPSVLPFRTSDIYFFPDCLRSALYTLFMLELSGRQRPAKLCVRPGCGRYFAPAHGRQQYCEKRCQQLAYYYRKRRMGQEN